MKYLEDELRKALRREPAPENFRGRLLARVAERGRAADRRWFRWTAAAALALILVAAGLRYQQEHQRRTAGQEATQQVMLALRITAEKLQFVQQKVQELGSPSREAGSQ